MGELVRSPRAVDVFGNPELEYRQTPAPESATVPTFKTILTTIWRRKGVILAAMVVITSLAGLVAFQLKPLYTAETTVMINSRSTQVLAFEQVVSGLGNDGEVVRGEIEVLKSRTLAERVVQKQELFKDAEFNPQLAGPQTSLLQKLNPMSYPPLVWLRPPEPDDLDAANPDPKRANAIAVSNFMTALSVDQVGRSRVIRIQFTSRSAAKAKAIADAIADSYLADQVEVKSQGLSQATGFLNSRINELRAKVEESEQAVERYRKEKNLVVSDSGTSVNSQQLSELNTQVTVARTKRQESESRIRQIQSLRDRPELYSLPEVLASAAVQNLRQQEVTLTRRAAEFAQQYREEHPAMIKLRAEQVEVQSKINTEVDRIVQGLRADLEIARGSENGLVATLRQLEGSAQQQNEAGIQLRQLQREAQANRALFESFLTRFKETSNQQDLQQADARILSRAVEPTGPSYPNTRLIIFSAWLSSIFLGLIIVFLLEELDSGYRSFDQIEASLGLKALGLIPDLPASMLRTDGTATVKPMFFYRQSSNLGEAFRNLRIGLSLSDVDSPPRSILVTSSLQGEGKSFVAASLAQSEARAGKAALLIDCDLRRPTQHVMFGLPNQRGLVDLLMGECALEDVLEIDAASGARIITAGQSRLSSPDLFGSSAMRKLMERLRNHFDPIIIDSPPLSFADSLILTRLVDKTLFVVRWETTRREVVQRAVHTLLGAGADIAGVVLNRVNLRRHAQYGFGDSGMNYYNSYYNPAAPPGPD